MLRLMCVALALGLCACGGQKDDGADKAGTAKAGKGSALKDAPPANPAKQVALIAESGDDTGAKALLERFLKPETDVLALSRALRPKAEDYAAVYTAEIARKMDGLYGPAWDADQIRVAPKPGQTQLLLWGATSEELKAGGGNASKFPGGYARVKDALKAGVRVYRFKFVKPGETIGMAFDGLAHVNGRWVLIPKPWRALK